MARVIAVLLGLGSAAAAAAGTVTTSRTAPAAGVVATGATDGHGASVLWTSQKADTDLGATFRNSGPRAMLGAITVRITPENVGTRVAGMPLVVQFYSFDGKSRFTPLWQEQVSMPATVAGDDYLTIDFSDRRQELAPDAHYAFLIGAAIQGATDEYRFRLYGRAETNPGDAANTFEIRRDREFGASRPALTALPDTLNTGRDLLFYVQSAAAAAVVSAAAQAVAPPTFSGGAGTLVLSTSTPGANIRYTTDGSDPSPTQGTLYTDPIPIQGTIRIRAIAYRDGIAPSAIKTATVKRGTE